MKRHLDEEQIYALKYTMGNTEAEKVFKTFKFESKWNAPKKDNRAELEERNESPADYDCVINKYNMYFIPTKNRRHERVKFQKRVQKMDEPFEQFYRDICTMAKVCEYPDTDEMLLDKIIQGIRDQDLSKRMELMSGLTLPKAVQMVKQTKQIDNERRERSMEEKQAEEIKQSRLHYKGRGSSNIRGRGTSNTQGRGGSYQWQGRG